MSLAPPLLRTVLCVLAGVFVASCTIRTAEVPPEGRLEIVGPGPAFAVGTLKSDWVVTGARSAAANKMRVVTLDGVPALRIDGGSESFAVVRRTKARLLASPYLSWSWQMQAPRTDAHPLRIVVGFHGGRPDSRSWGGEPLVWTGRKLPPHDRVMAIVFGPSGLQRGSFLPAPEPQNGRTAPALPRYVVRGGPENAEQWRLDTVDLSLLYREVWPNDDAVAARIAFIGFAYQPAGDDPAPPRGYLSGLVLSR